MNVIKWTWTEILRNNILRCDYVFFDSDKHLGVEISNKHVVVENVDRMKPLLPMINAYVI